MRRCPSILATFLAALLLAVGLWGCGSNGAGSAVSSIAPGDTGSSATVVGSGPTTDSVFAEAFARRASGLEVEGQGTVQRLLPDDVDGDHHQRFIVELASGQTLLLAHNIDVAPRVEGLQVGKVVSFRGEYEWNDQGGVVHWTHHDPSGDHVAGWIDYLGKRYQ